MIPPINHTPDVAQRHVSTCPWRSLQPGLLEASLASMAQRQRFVAKEWWMINEKTNHGWWLMIVNKLLFQPMLLIKVSVVNYVCFNDCLINYCLKRCWHCWMMVRSWQMILVVFSHGKWLLINVFKHGRRIRLECDWFIWCCSSGFVTPNHDQ